MPEVIVNCPSCRQEFSIDSTTLGRQFQCVQCGRTFTAVLPVPTQTAPMAAPVAAPASPTAPPAYFGEPAPTAAPLSKVALAALICSLLCWIWPVSIAALVLGIIGVVQTKNHQRRGSGLAITGIVLGAIGLFADPVVYLMISVLLPAMNIARQAANGAVSQAKMRQIGVAMSIYESQNRGEYPPDLETLATAQSLSTSLFVTPGGKDTPADSISALSSGGHLSYVYIPMPTPPAHPTTTVVLYEAGPGHLEHRVRGLNLLYADGHVMFESMATANREIQTSRQNAGATPGFLQSPVP
jgi:prepilin-type processing-associated H-X9-DG protein